MADEINLSCLDQIDIPSLSISSLKILNLSHNRIKDARQISHLKTLEELNLSSNEIENISYLNELTKLRVLDISYNVICRIDSQYCLNSNLDLHTLTVRGNPFIWNHMRYEIKIKALVDSLQIIDDQEMDKIMLSQVEDEESIVLDNDYLLCRFKSMIDIHSGVTEWRRIITKLELNHCKIAKIGDQGLMPNLKLLSLKGNYISEINGLDLLSNLEELNLEDNKLKEVKCIENLIELQKLELGGNRIVTIINCFTLQDKLTHLSLEHNQIISLEYLSPLVQLLELYIGENQITDIKEIRHLANLEKLIVVDLWGNPICKDFDYRLFVIYHIKDVKVLDGISISQSEYEEAKEAFTGRLSEELLQVKLAGKDFSKIEVMDQTNSSLRDFNEIFNTKKFPNCSELNLEGNFFSSFRCFGFMPNLKILIMRNNRLQDIDATFDNVMEKQMLNNNTNPSISNGLGALIKLEVLDISKNKIKTLEALSNYPLSELHILKVSKNMIKNIEGVRHLTNLRDLDFSSNRIRTIEPHSFHHTMKLKYLCLDENLIRNFSNLAILPRLQHLFVRYNKISEYSEIGRLSDITTLRELEISSNPQSRKLGYRFNVIQRIPSLIYLDGREITSEERRRIELAMQQEISKWQMAKPPQGHKVMVKMSNITFDEMLRL